MTMNGYFTAYRSQDMMGPAQERWLMEGLRGSPARWNLLANQVLISQLVQTR